MSLTHLYILVTCIYSFTAKHSVPRCFIGGRNVPEVHHGNAQRGMECPAKGSCNHCGLAFDEERIWLCSFVAPFRVLGSTVINAWVIGLRIV